MIGSFDMEIIMFKELLRDYIKASMRAAESLYSVTVWVFLGQNNYWCFGHFSLSS